MKTKEVKSKIIFPTKEVLIKDVKKVSKIIASKIKM